MKTTNKDIAKRIRSAGREPVIVVRPDIRDFTPESIDRFKSHLELVLSDMKPTFAAIGGNETSLIPDAMSLRSYVKLLTASLEVSSDMNTSCINGGIEAGALLTSYISSWSGKEEKSSLIDLLDMNEKSFLTDNTFREERDRTARTVTSLLEAYKKMGLGHVNLHWNTYPISVFIKISELIRDKYGLQTVSTEMEVPIDPDKHEDALRSIKDRNLDCVVWYFPFEGRASRAVFRDDTLTKLSQPLRDINRSIF